MMKSEIQKFLSRNKVPHGVRVLEIGCGAGENVCHISSLGYQGHGMDIVPSAIESARQKADAVPCKAAFMVGDASELAGCAAFDAVIDGNCLWMMSGRAREKCLKRVWEILVPGGVFLARALQDNEKVREVIEVTPHVRFDPIRRISLLDDVPAYQFSTMEAFQAEIVRAGFEVLSCEVAKSDSPDEPFFAGIISVDARKAD